MNYSCPVCTSPVEPCRPFSNTEQQMHLPTDGYRIPKNASGGDVFDGRSAGTEPMFVCWECNSAYRRSDCRIDHSTDLKAVSAGDAW